MGKIGCVYLDRIFNTIVVELEHCEFYFEWY